MTTAKRAPNFYAVEWHPYGRIWNSRTGRPFWILHRFPSAAYRYAWVAARPTDYTDHKGYREAVSTRNADVRAQLRREAREEYFSVSAYVSGIVDHEHDSYEAELEAQRREREAWYDFEDRRAQAELEAVYAEMEG
jgi:hypothetical protein